MPTVSPIWYIIPGVGAGIDAYKPGGEFFKSIQSTAAQGELIVCHPWHEKEFVETRTRALLEMINNESYEYTIIKETLNDTDPSVFSGAKMIQRIIGAYELALQIINNFSKENTSIKVVATSFGGHVIYGASQLLGESNNQDLITPDGIATILTPMLHIVQGRLNGPTTKGKLFNFLSKCNQFCCGLYACCLEEWCNCDDALETAFDDIIKVWELCHKLVQNYKQSVLKKNADLLKIEQVVTIGTPFVRGVFTPNKDIIQSIKCFYSEGDMVAMLVGNQETENQINFRVKMKRKGWCGYGNPTHMELCGDPRLGALVPKLSQFNHEGIFEFKKNGDFEFNESPTDL